ncbi:MAG TPA: MgtC/SapB family protein [Allosphingosinicella sp.]|jgi:putative Mg2+ transporter-C (MgtC) family protein
MMGADPLEVNSLEELTLRLGLAVLVGLLLGLDREMRGHDAGIRTHALVALSSAMIMISSLLLYSEMRGAGGGNAPDPLRAVQGLAQSIGFIAAGLIFVKGGAVRNMTTAANIWIAAAVGIACGCGQYALVLIGAGMAVALLTLMKLFERFLPKRDPNQAED